MRVKKILTGLTQLKFSFVCNAEDDTKWKKIWNDHGTTLSNYATLLSNATEITKILPRRGSEAPLLNLIILHKRRRNRVVDDDEEKEEEDKITALKVYSKRESLSSLGHPRPHLHAARIRLPARHYEISHRENSFCRGGISKFP